MTMNPFDLTGKVALVTGGNGGIGLAIGLALARAGATVVAWGLNPEKNAATETKLSEFGVGHRVQKVDVSDESAVIMAMAEIIERHDKLDVVVANAGVMGQNHRFVETSTGDWRHVMKVNLDAVFWTFREACKHIGRRAKAGKPGASLIAVSSTSAIHGAPRNEAYASTKAAVAAMVRGIAVEHAADGIRANAILPGWVRSDMTSGLQSWDRFNEKVIARVPAGRWGEPDDFAGIAIYLASDMSRFHTGDSIVIDGGYTIF